MADRHDSSVAGTGLCVNITTRPRPVLKTGFLPVFKRDFSTLCSVFKKGFLPFFLGFSPVFSISVWRFGVGRLLNPYMWERCTAYQAIIHPWFGEHLQRHPMEFDLPQPDIGKDLPTLLGYKTLEQCRNCEMEACPIRGAHDVESSGRFPDLGL